MAIRKKQEPDEYQKALRKFHKKSNRHVVVFEADISEDEKRHIFSDADQLRQCGNELLGIMKRNLEQLLRTKRYRVLQKLYGKVSDRRKCGRRTAVREFRCSGSDVSAKVLAMYAGTRTSSMEPQWLAAGLSQTGSCFASDCSLLAFLV